MFIGTNKGCLLLNRRFCSQTEQFLFFMDCSLLRIVTKKGEIFCKSLSTQGHSGFWFFSVLCTRHKLPLNCSVDTKYLFFYFSAHRVTYILHGRQCFQGKLFIRHNRNGKGKIQMIDYLNKHFPPCRNCCKARTKSSVGLLD